MSGKNKFQGLLEKVSRYLNRKTLYPMVIGSWKHVQHPESLQMIFDTGYFKNYLKAETPDLTNVKHILVIAPHQDDEAIGCGGFLLKMKDQAKITVVFVTDGAQDNLGISTADSIELRNAEARNALQYFGGEVEFLGLSNLNLKTDEESVRKLQTVLSKYDPDLILSPWIFDRPKKHRLVNILLYKVLKNLKNYRRKPIWSYQVHNVIYPNIVVDITKQREQKGAMIREYASQMQKVAPYDHYILGMNQWNAQYLQHNKLGYAEVYFGLPVDDWLNFYTTSIIPFQNSYLTKG